MEKNINNTMLVRRITQITTIEVMPINGNGNEPVKVEKQPVPLIAGFEWDCPHCKALNKTIDYVPFVKCRNCEEIFETQMPESDVPALASV